MFDQGDEGVCIKPSVTDFFRGIVDKVNTLSKARRAAIVFFQDERLQ